MKLISWNVNGIRACIKKGFLDFIQQENPEVICLQEIKANKEQVDISLPGYEQLWHSAEKKGYSGTAIFTKKAPLSFSLDMKDHAGEGRIINAEFPKFHLVNVYTPNAKRGLLRLDYRMQWDKDFVKHLKQLEKQKPVIFCGDLNVAHNEIDLKNPKSNRKNPGFTDEERTAFSKLLDAGYVDSFRHFNKDPGHYTWWSYMFNARANNVGWRIDYFGVSSTLQDKMKKAFILPHVLGSDHCPIGLELK